MRLTHKMRKVMLMKGHKGNTVIFPATTPGAGLGHFFVRMSSAEVRMDGLFGVVDHVWLGGACLPIAPDVGAVGHPLLVSPPAVDVLCAGVAGSSGVP